MHPISDPERQVLLRGRGGMCGQFRHGLFRAGQNAPHPLQGSHGRTGKKSYIFDLSRRLPENVRVRNVISLRIRMSVIGFPILEPRIADSHLATFYMYMTGPPK